MERKQATNRILMVRPANFAFNAETAVNNSYQKKDPNTSAVSNKAIEEFDNYVKLLREKGVNVTVVQDTFKPHTPDSIFPNNWFSTHCTGELFLYPMYASNRQKERKPHIMSIVRSIPGVTKEIDFTSYEKDFLYLEGTGSMVLDRVNKIVYTCASVRTAEEVLENFCCALGYKSVHFHAQDAAGNPIYHTNVMMAIAERYAVVCLDSVKEIEQRQRLEKSLKSTGHEIVAISLEQVEQFAGNMLEVYGNNEESLMLMSLSAFKSLTPEQRSVIEKFSSIIAPDLSTIEKNGGGSARCMVAEIFTPIN